MTAIGYRFDLLDVDLNRIGDLHPSMGSTARITNDTNQTVKRAMTGVRLDPDEADAVRPLSDRVRPWMITTDGEFPLGTFVFTETPRQRWTYGRPMTGSFVDPLIDLDQDTERPWSFKAADTIPLILRLLLTYSHVPLFEIDDSDALVGTKAVSWDAGTSMLQIINEVCAMGGYYSLFFDNDGVARAKEITELHGGASRTVQSVLAGRGVSSASRVSLRYGVPNGSASDVMPIVQGSIAESDDLLDAPNRYLVIDNGTTESPIYGHWDVPDEAPHSYANRKRRITHTTQMQGLANNTAATKMARLQGMKDRSTFQWATFIGAPNPLHDTFDAIEYFGEANWHEQSWSLDLTAAAKHTHEIRRVWTAGVTSVVERPDFGGI